MPRTRSKPLPSLGKTPLHYLKEWREFRSMTQEDLARMCGTSKSVISLLESGKRGLSTEFAHHLARALRTTPGFLIDHDPNQMLDTFTGPPPDMATRAHIWAVGMAALAVRRR